VVLEQHAVYKEEAVAADRLDHFFDPPRAADFRALDRGVELVDPGLDHLEVDAARK